MAQLKILMLFLLCFIKIAFQAPVAADNAAAQLNENKKGENQEIKIPMESSYNVKPEVTGVEEMADNDKEIVISEKPLVLKNIKSEGSLNIVPSKNAPPQAKDVAKNQEEQNESNPKSKSDETNASKEGKQIKKDEQSQDKGPVEEKSVFPQEGPALYRNKIYAEDLDIPDSYRMGSYFLVAISSVAIMFIVFKIYRMRLSRAERKYGVQGNRATQELTPLPMSIDDLGNSDDEDQTLFDRHQIRIL